MNPIKLYILRFLHIPEKWNCRFKYVFGHFFTSIFINELIINLDDSISSEPEDLDSFYNSYSSNTALSSSDTKEAVPLATKLPEKAPVFTTDGRPLGMFPKNQATTMCVDVVSVYTPPVDSGFKLDPSESLSAESSAMTSSVSNSSSISSIAGNGKSTNEANATTTGSRDAGESASSCVTDSEHAQDIDEEEEDPNESIFIDEKISNLF